MPTVTEMILENERLVYRLANDFKGYVSNDDLYQAGCLGIVKAYENYDVNFGVKFSSYAYSYIAGEMKKLIREDRPFKVGRDTYRLKGKIEEARARLSQSMMRMPTDAELSEFLDISEEELAEAVNSSLSPRYLDENFGDTEMMLHEIISSPMADIDDLVCLKAELEELEEPERTIMINRYYEDMTQSEIADNLGLKQVDVSRRQNKVLTYLRENVN